MPTDEAWKILIVDDDPDVHEVTRLALRRLEFKERSLVFLSAHSGAEAREVLSQASDIAVILLDVVMETRDSGLQLVDYIRTKLDNRRTRILLRTGQPGEAPEDQVILAYDINNYLSKTELTRQKLITNIVAALRSHDEILQIENRRREIAEQAAANQARSAFLANMSHELGTPLNAILGFTRLLTRSHALSTQQLDYLNIITQSGRNLLGLINRVMEMSKLDAGFAELEESPVALNQHLQAIVAMLQGQANGRDVELLLDIAADVPPCVIVDIQKLQQILVNLLSNALKFTEHGRVALRVHAADHSTQTGSLIRFEVEDSGPGIARDEQQRIFETFVQGRSRSRTGSGMGLGLAISKKFAELMGGTLSVESTLGQGSVFCLQLGLLPAQIPEAVMQADSRSVVGLAGNQRTFRILVVDDGYENRALFEGLLTAAGFTVQTTPSFSGALEILGEWKPELIFLDARISALPGTEAIREIREAERKQAMPPAKLVLLVAASLQGEVDRLLAAGGDGVLIKPVREEQLFETLKSQLKVQFLYEMDAGAESPPIKANKLQLEQLPPEWLARLHRAAEAADDLLVSELLNEIEAHHPAEVDVLRQLVARFDFRRIMSISSPDAAPI